MSFPEKMSQGMARKPRRDGQAAPAAQPRELVSRLDGASPAPGGEVQMAKMTALDGSREAGPAQMGVDRGSIDEAAAWISAKVAATIKLGAQEVGEYVLEKFFRNDPELAKSRNPHKNASFRALAAKCGTPQLPISKSWLHNAVGVALMLRQLPETAKTFKELLPSYQDALLPLKDPAIIDKVAKHAVTKELSLRELRQAVADERSKMPKDQSQGRPPAPIVMKTLGHALKLFAFEGGKGSFTKADVEALDDEQRKDAIESTQDLIEKLEDLLGKLKKA